MAPEVNEIRKRKVQADKRAINEQTRILLQETNRSPAPPDKAPRRTVSSAAAAIGRG